MRPDPLRDSGSDAVAGTGDALGAELFSVYQAGSETIPRVAVLYRRVGSAIWRSGTATRPRTDPVDRADRPDASRDPILSLDEFRLPSILVS